MLVPSKKLIADYISYQAMFPIDLLIWLAYCVVLLQATWLGGKTTNHPLRT